MVFERGYQPRWRRTVYRADQETDGLYELYVTYEEQELTVSFTAVGVGTGRWRQRHGNRAAQRVCRRGDGGGRLRGDGGGGGGGVDFDLAAGPCSSRRGHQPTITINLVDDGLVEGTKR